ncbi:response regulator [Paenibacillus hemerocallicola]|uniref:Response regulator n=2 Tax=Paenibacillus hemerocallicola TaxID=1172614 RepID=A0A5C4T4K8_9BACL|nr:response regulator [Paenibacillus hemerocallicola]
MIRMLIVDDEPYTVDGLYEMLSDIPDLELDLYRAYSAEDAMQLLTRIRMDIVLSDIRMPGMNGLELLEWIRARWPRCKVLFLTGFSDIQYAQQALRGGGVDYILKTEGDEKIVLGLRNAIRALNEEMDNDRAIAKAREQYLRALPLLQKEWFLGLADARNKAAHLRPERFLELDIPLSPQGQVLFVGGKVDRWEPGYGSSDQMLMCYAIQNVAVELLAQAKLLTVLLDASRFVWMIQPSAPEEEWSDTAWFVKGTLESIQLTCKNVLNVPVSLVCTDAPVSWEELPRTYAQLKQTLMLGLGDGEEMLVTMNREPDSEPLSYDYPGAFVLEELKQALESGYEVAFERTLEELYARIPNRIGLHTQAYYAVAMLLIARINTLEPGDPLLGGPAVGQLMNLSAHESREAALVYLKKTAAELFSRRQRLLVERTDSMILKINQYIREHLHGDLSLVALAEFVYLNPTYLSVLYKKSTGKTLSEHIAELRVEKAKELLARPEFKIHEIAIAVGFGNAGYFTRFFKKHTGATPQDYRNAVDMAAAWKETNKRQDF